VSTLTALAVHPSHLKIRDGFLDTGKYEVPVRDDLSDGQTVGVAFPYRSTLKKIQATRVGTIPNGITAEKVAIVPSTQLPDPRDKTKVVQRGYIEGKLTNSTGTDLANVFIAFRWDSKQEFMLYLPTWGKGVAIDVEQAFLNAAPNWTAQTIPLRELPTSNRSRRGDLRRQWSPLFQTYAEGFSAGGLGTGDGEAKELQNIRANLVMMSLFDRIDPQRNEQGGRSRTDLIRREGRELDLSPALSAGRVIVLAEARDVPLPYPLEVDGDVVAGVGSTFYQFVLPADRTKIDAYEATQAADEQQDGDTPADAAGAPPTTAVEKQGTARAGRRAMRGSDTSVNRAVESPVRRPRPPRKPKWP
jgi:hypothetical protein